MKTILDVVRDLRAADPPLQYLEEGEPVAYGKFLEFEMTRWNGQLRTVPSEALNLPGRPGDRSFLYRGQVVRYPTCESSVLRGVPQNEWQIKARLVLERVRVAELGLLLRDHPFTAVVRNSCGCCVDYHGLAQHYGIPTSLLDLTSSVEVAAFFAVAEWDREARKWTPKETGVGVMYRFDWTAFGSGYTGAFTPVGFGPGLRPARQHAWTFRLRPGVDFQSVPHVAAIDFGHSKAASAELFAKFDSGSRLYPPDCLASLVEKLRDLPFVTTNAIRDVMCEDGAPPDQIEALAERAAQFLSAELGIEVLDGYELQPEEADLDIAKQQAPALEDAIRKLRAGFRLQRIGR